MPRSRRWGLLATTASCALLAMTALPAAGAGPGSDDLTPDQRRAVDAGIQVSPKVTGSAGKAKAKAGVNPYLANLPDIKKADYASWRQHLAAQGDRRAATTSLARAKNRAAGRALAAPFVHDEEEPAGTSGANDTRANAEPVGGFGTGRGENPRVRILGQLSNLDPPSQTLAVRREDNGSIRLATATGINGVGSRSSSSVLGDGPHGSAGDGSNDFDFFSLTSRAGLTITVDTTATEETDTLVALYDAAGDLLAVDDDAFVGPNELASRLTFTVRTTGRYFVLVAGYSEEGPLPEDPTDSGSGAGGAEQGPYRVKITSGEVDRDYFALRLDKGDVIGAVGNGIASNLRIWRPDGRQMVGAEKLDASYLYAPNSPLPGGGNTTLAYVAEQSGSYAIQVLGNPGNYDTLVEAYRPGTEIDPSNRVQTVFLDFDGARVNTGIWGGPGVRTLSPFSTFLPGWRLTRAQESLMIDRITAVVRENIRQDLIAKGINDQVTVRVLNSKNDRDVFGQTNVSRVIVGGSIAQSGIETIGIAQYIDPGNYGHEDSALVLLDVLSDRDPDNDASLNYYLRARSDRARFVSRAIGNVISHEIGHLIGNFHTDHDNGWHQLMDSGGANFGTNLYGVGRDNIGGTADDEDIDFGTDAHDPLEGFTGSENTLNISAWAYAQSRTTP